MKPLQTLPLALLACALASAAPAPSPAAAPQPAQEPGPRPGLIEIPAGQVVLGNDFERVQELAQSDVVNASFYVGELGRSVVTVDRFWIGPTPVTNEMYLAYVEDAGVMPPPDWAVISKELRQELVRQGQDPDGDGEDLDYGYKFDENEQLRWWMEVWQSGEYEWEMPPSRALEPVVFVSYRDALGYCRWAGVRMPFEAEWVRAARGDSDQDYPWGEEFDPTRVAFQSTQPDELKFRRLPVGMLDNASPFGVVDMAGQVWEFTEDRYSAYEAAASIEDRVKVTQDDGGERIVYPNFETSRYVIKGGSFVNEPEMLRVDMRIGMDSEAPAHVLGFRVAASDNRLGDVAWTRARGTRLDTRALGGQPLRLLDFGRAVGVEKRSYPDMGTVRAARAEPEEPLRMPELPDSYAVLGPVRALVFTPLADPFEDYDHGSPSKIERAAEAEGKLPAFGVLSSTNPFLGGDGTAMADGEPVPAGDYVLVYFPELRQREIEEYGGRTEDTKEEDLVEKPEKSFNVDISGVELLADEPQVLVVDRESKALLALPMVNLNNKIKVQADRKQDSGAAVDLQRNRIRIDMEFPGPGTKTYFLSIGLRPLNEDASLALTDVSDWDAGTFEVVEKKKD